MYHFAGIRVVGGGLVWQFPGKRPGEDGLQIAFVLSDQMSRRLALQAAESCLQQNSIEWIRPSRSKWELNVPGFRAWLSEPLPTELDWLDGVVVIEPEVEDIPSPFREPPHFGQTVVMLTIYKEDYILDHSTKLFLSHKGADKPMVKRFFTSLKELGFDPWIDEAAMPAGTELHRGILQGFKDSCAAVFFITPHFRDESYLRSEINHAVEQKNQKAGRFSIITLVFPDKAGHKRSVPELLRSYVWKEPSSELEALTEIVRALPITLGPPNWRPGL